MTRPRVLLADDQPQILEYVSAQLAADFEIVGQMSGGQAMIEAASALKPDAVVLDISMPDMCGLDVARRILEWPNPPRIVFLTVLEDQEFVDAAAAMGVAAYVLKRDMTTQLADAIHRILAG